VFDKENIDPIWKSFCKHIDNNMPARAGHCPFCFKGLHATLDTYGDMYFFCDCVEWVMFVEEFKLDNQGAFDEREEDE